MKCHSLAEPETACCSHLPVPAGICSAITRKEAGYLRNMLRNFSHGTRCETILSGACGCPETIFWGGLF